MKIRELRVQNGLLQTELAQKINKSAVCIGDWERGRCEPSIEDLIKLADIFGVSVGYLIGHEDDLGNVATSGVALSSQEQRILMIYRALSERDKKTIENLFETLSPTGINDVRA